MYKSIAVSLACVVAVVAVQACAQNPTTNSLSLESIQGVWWSDCQDPAAEFAIDGSEYYGDFLGKFKLDLTGDVLVFRDGLIDGHSINVTHRPLSFQVMAVASGKLVLRPMPGNPYVGDWELFSCEGMPPNQPLHPDALPRASERRH